MLNILEAEKRVETCCPNYDKGRCLKTETGEKNLWPYCSNQCCIKCEKFCGECTELCEFIEDQLGIAKLLKRLDEIIPEEESGEPSFEFINAGSGLWLVAKDYRPLNADDVTVAVFFYSHKVSIFWSESKDLIKRGLSADYRPLNLSDFDNDHFTPLWQDVILSNKGDCGDCAGVLNKHDLEFLKNAWKIIKEWYEENHAEVIYIAGPDVFHPHAKNLGEKMKKTCREKGFEPIFPLDNKDTKADKKQLANAIFKNNISSIKESDIIVANLASFRGAEPDSGTVFELGVGYGLGKILYGYIPKNTTLADKMRRYYGTLPTRANFHDKDGYLIEDFGYPLNLMISESVKIVVGGFEDCIEQVRKDLKNTLPIK